MQSMDIALKGIKAVCIYDMLREGVNSVILKAFCELFI